MNSFKMPDQPYMLPTCQNSMQHDFGGGTSGEISEFANGDYPAAENRETERNHVKEGPSKCYYYKTKMCPHMTPNNWCSRGVRCGYAHSEEELRDCPNLVKTKWCPDLKGPHGCKDSLCRFAHDESELRHTELFYKTKICHMWKKGKCPPGRMCRHAHGMVELQKYRGLAKASRAALEVPDIHSQNYSDTTASESKATRPLKQNHITATKPRPDRTEEQWIPSTFTPTSMPTQSIPSPLAGQNRRESDKISQPFGEANIPKYPDRVVLSPPGGPFPSFIFPFGINDPHLNLTSSAIFPFEPRPTVLSPILTPASPLQGVPFPSVAATMLSPRLSGASDKSDLLREARDYIAIATAVADLARRAGATEAEIKAALTPVEGGAPANVGWMSPPIVMGSPLQGPVMCKPEPVVSMKRWGELLRGTSDESGKDDDRSTSSSCNEGDEGDDGPTATSSTLVESSKVPPLSSASAMASSQTNNATNPSTDKNDRNSIQSLRPKHDSPRQLSPGPVQNFQTNQSITSPQSSFSRHSHVVSSPLILPNGQVIATHQYSLSGQEMKDAHGNSRGVALSYRTASPPPMTTGRMITSPPRLPTTAGVPLLLAPNDQVSSFLYPKYYQDGEVSYLPSSGVPVTADQASRLFYGSHILTNAFVPTKP